MSQEKVLEKVKKLRELTGVGFKDCKIAIDENNGDIDKEGDNDQMESTDNVEGHEKELGGTAHTTKVQFTSPIMQCPKNSAPSTPGNDLTFDHKSGLGSLQEPSLSLQ